MKFIVTRTMRFADGGLKLVRNELESVAEFLDEIAVDLPWEVSNALRILLTEEKSTVKMRNIKFDFQRSRHCDGFVLSNMEKVEITCYYPKI